MSSLYGNYSALISDQLRNGQKRGTLKKGFVNESHGLSGISSTKAFMSKEKDEELFFSLKPLTALAERKAKYHQKPGAHPDFSHLKQSRQVEQHYITSVFLDIKNSTGLFKNYEPVTVANITTTIQRVAIHTCWVFDGYVQRFHGDGLFLYFGGKNSTIKDSVLGALNTATLFNHYIENDLKQMFNENGVENISTRIGIDTGEAPDVVWHLAGMEECSEVTTCSLHTSLAAKMQSNAERNGVMAGDNVKKYSNLNTDLFSIKKDRDQKEDRYIFDIPAENFRYTQWQFDWKAHLKSISKLSVGSDNKLYIPDNKPNLNYLNSQVSGYRPSF
jgi:adenylate cyclase